MQQILDATNIEQGQPGMVSVIGMNESIGYDQIHVGTVDGCDQTVNPGLEFE